MDRIETTLPLALRALIDSVRVRAAVAESASVSADSVPESGIRLRLTPWFPIAQSEDNDALSPFPADERLFPSRMRMLVRNFDPLKFRPPVILGTNSADPGPAHMVGEWNEVPGFIVRMEYDGLHLWAQAAEVQDPESGAWRISEAVACGHLGRSVGFWLSKPGADGGFMLRHLALLSGEPEGQMGQALPPLSSYFRSFFAPTDAARADAEAFRSTGILWPVGQTPQPLKERAMNEQEIDALVSRVGQRVGEQITTAATTAAQSAVQAALPAAIAPLTEQLTALQTELRTSRESAEASARTARESGYRSQLEALVRSGHLDPAELDVQLRSLMELPASSALPADILKAIGARKVSSVQSTPLTITTGETSRTFELPSGVDITAIRNLSDTLRGVPEGAAGDAELQARVLGSIGKRYGAN